MAKKMVKVSMEITQRMLETWSCDIEVPASVAKKGKDAICDYIIKNHDHVNYNNLDDSELVDSLVDISNIDVEG